MRSTLVRDVAIVVLFTSALLMTTWGHQAFLDGCVCIANSILRAIVVLGVGLGAMALECVLASGRTMAFRMLGWLRSLALVLGAFFLIQHAYFILEAG